MARSSAPGKLFISGEYAILDGGVAIVTAVDVRARVSVAHCDGADSRLRHPVTGHEFGFSIDHDGRLDWSNAPPAEWAAIPEAVIAAWVSLNGPPDQWPAMSIQIDTADFYAQVSGQRSKLGLGSSAAATVALAGALAAALGESSDAPELQTVCLAAHAALQNGRGSGADVLAALHGGVLAIQTQTETRSLVWPSGFFAVPVWTGTPTASVEMIDRFLAYRRDTIQDWSRQLANLKDIGAVVAGAWERRDTTELLLALKRSDSALTELDAAANIGIDSAIHRALRKISTEAGCVYKVSGAGGGDFGIAFTNSEVNAHAVRDAFIDSGYTVLEFAISSPGLRVYRD